MASQFEKFFHLYNINHSIQTLDDSTSSTAEYLRHSKLPTLDHDAAQAIDTPIAEAELWVAIKSTPQTALPLSITKPTHYPHSSSKL